MNRNRRHPYTRTNARHPSRRRAGACDPRPRSRAGLQIRTQDRRATLVRPRSRRREKRPPPCRRHALRDCARGSAQPRARRYGWRPNVSPLRESPHRRENYRRQQRETARSSNVITPPGNDPAVPDGGVCKPRPSTTARMERGWLTPDHRCALLARAEKGGGTWFCGVRDQASSLYAASRAGWPSPRSRAGLAPNAVVKK